MRSAREWPRWALKMARLHGLNDGEARMLNALAAHANRDGEVYASEETLAAAAGRAPRTARNLLKALRRRGLVSSDLRGPHSARRVLNDVLPVEQLALPVAVATYPQPGRKPGRQSAGHESPVDRPIAVHESPAATATPRSQQEVKGGREDAPARPLPRALPATLDLVEEIGRVHGPDWLVVQRDALVTVLLAHPEDGGHDHEAAALEAAQQANEAVALGGKTTVTLFSYLLKKKLERQRHRAERVTSAPVRQRPAKPWDGALRRAREQAEAAAAAAEGARG